MYTEEPKRTIDWGNVIKKGLIFLVIAAVIFLFIWLFTRNNSNSVNVDYENENTVNETLTNPDSYSESFINNYRYFHDTAKEYFLISELPSSGNTLKYTLQQLIDKGLILPFSYGNETCDTEASYVTVTNNNGKYIMTTTLVCGKEVAKTTEELGCNQLCTDKSCVDKTKIEYQYKQAYKATDTVYSCPSGYTKSGSKCYKNNSSTTTPSKITTYTCPSGYTKSGSGENTKCTKGNETIINATPNTTYSCSKGKLSGNKCIIETTVNAKANTTYSCSSGELKGNKCVTTTNAKANTTYTCAKGDLVNSKYCRVYASSSYYQTYTTYKGKTYNGCTYSGSYTDSCSSYSGCTKTYYKYYCSKSSYNDVAATPNTTYSCSSGERNGTKCVTTTNAKANTTYSCAKGERNGTKCIITENAKANTTYTCTSGEKNGTKCIIPSSVNATPKTTYSCPNGYEKYGSTKCKSDGTTSTNAIKNVNYTCPNGYTKTGLGSSSMCTKGSTSTINATKSTKTLTKYKYKWSSETSLEGWEKTGKTREVSSK